MLYFTVFCLLATAGYVLGECSDGCSEPTLFYEALNCKPVFTSPVDCCPSEYDCSNIEQKAAANEKKCYFRGNAYNPGQQVNDNETYGNCAVGCGCTELRNENMGFVCAELDCPEWLGFHPKPGCYLKYKLDECCMDAEACPPFKTTCELNGKTYKEGQEFTAPDLKCTTCICQEGFEGKFEAPFCKKRGCIDEVDRQNEVYSFCAPSYRTLNDCCPVYWICPEEGDKIVTATNVINPKLKCKFGEKTLNIGDKFERTSGEKGKVSCECRIPPYLTCVQNHDYPIYASPSY